MSTKRIHHSRRRLDDLIRKYGCTPKPSSERYWRLIDAIRSRSSILAGNATCGPIDIQDEDRIVRACFRMAKQHFYWTREPESWRADDEQPSASRFIAFRSLVGHLFEKYPAPLFMRSVWLADEMNWQRRLYLHLAKGLSVRCFQLPRPFPLSKRAAAFFMQAPDDFDPRAALRWGQLRALGADRSLARLLTLKTVLTHLRHEPFWDSVVRFLVANQPLEEQEILAIVDFIHRQRFRPAAEVWGRGAGQEPLQPDFTLRHRGGRGAGKGSALRWLRRHMINWREEVEVTIQPPPVRVKREVTWQATNISGFERHDGNRIWKIEELLSDQELRVEGGIMRHCVGGYINACKSRRSSIWSMQVVEANRHKRVLTIEVLPETKQINQAKGKRNASPSDEAVVMLRHWANQEGLSF